MCVVRACRRGVFFFFKQKTAYEVRISDWSSDVCSSDLPYEGPAAGASAIVVITFVVSTLPISTLGFGEAWLFGGIVAVGAPLGQILASALLPVANAPATALRRLDSLLIVGPLWVWGVGLVM